ncbi:MAG: WD40/YVTN/BNR-like repeat-containing protein, partial [Mycobacteriales bacterium]
MPGLFGSSAEAVAAVPPPAVTDVNPNNSTRALFGGRVEKLALDPVNHQKMFAASELGGFWVTNDGGAHWQHIDAIPIFRAQDIKIATSDPNLVVAVGNYEQSTTNRGGAWISTDGGSSWAQATGETPTCNAEAAALSVAFGTGAAGSIPVYVGNTCGLARSLNSGQTWTQIDVDGSFTGGGSSHQVEDVEVRPGGGGQTQVDVCGPQGFFRSEDGGGTWTAADPNSPLLRPATDAGIIGNAFGICNVDIAPGNANIVYLSNFEGGTSSGFCHGQLLENRNGGAAGSWTQMGSDVSDNNCRDTFVQTRDNADNAANTYDVYFGSSVRILRQTCDSNNTPSCATGIGNWPRWDMNSPHTDPTNIAFDETVTTGCPLFIAGDGGVFKATSDGCAATPSFDPANVGMHAFDSSQLAGTVWPTHTDLYFALQDNGTFYTGDGGANYANEGPDSYDVNADLQGNPGASVLRRDCFGCSVNRKGPGVPAGPAFGGGLGFGAPPSGDYPNE